MISEIFKELIAIRKELQEIRGFLELICQHKNCRTEISKGVREAVLSAVHDSGAKVKTK